MSEKLPEYVAETIDNITENWLACNIATGDQVKALRAAIIRFASERAAEERRKTVEECASLCFNMEFDAGSSKCVCGADIQGGGYKADGSQACARAIRSLLTPQEPRT